MRYSTYLIVQVPSAPLRPSGRVAASLRLVAPGLALALAGAGVGFLVHALIPGVPVVLVAIALGLLVANVWAVPVAARPGLALASGALLRVGIVLLGFELVLQDMLTLGARGLLVVVVVVVATFFGTRWAGRRLGVSEGLSLLVATGFSICGVSAIAAARGVSEADEEEVTYAIALVTLCGSLAIVLLPAMRGILGLDEHDFGVWVGASVHDVAQVVATSSAVGGVAVATAIVVKLTRVLLLGPLVAWIAWTEGRSTGVSPWRLVPPFVLAFVGAAALRSADLVPSGLLPVLADTKIVLLAIALFAVGARVELGRLLMVGGRPLVLGLSSWVIVAAVAYAGVMVVWS
jgi:uncharacterized integral membrane protein (TIGR00698 family)